MKTMIAEHRFPYGLDHVEKDAPFEAHDHDVEMLEHSGLARLKRAPKAGAQYSTKVMTAADPARPNVAGKVATPEAPPTK